MEGRAQRKAKQLNWGYRFRCEVRAAGEEEEQPTPRSRAPEEAGRDLDPSLLRRGPAAQSAL